MKAALKRFLKVLALLVPIAAMVLFTQEYLFYYEDDNGSRISGFYTEPADSLDMVMLGASEVYNGFAPGYAYDYSGLTSYLYASTANSGALYLSQVKEIFAHQDPQLLIIEVHGFLAAAQKELYGDWITRRYVENIPMSTDKIATILRHGYDDPISYLVPFFKYHEQCTDDAQELCRRFHNRIQQKAAPNHLKGYGTSSHVHSGQPLYDVTENDDTLPLLPEAEAYLLELLAYLQSHHLADRVIFIRFPHKLLTEELFERYLRANRVEEIITEYGFDYLDLEQNIMDTGLDYEYDFLDSEHLNYYGQMKLTEYLCDKMTEDYGLEPMTQTDENRQRWEESAAYVHALQIYADEIAEKGRSNYLYETPELLRELEKRLAQ